MPGHGTQKTRGPILSAEKFIARSTLIGREIIGHSFPLSARSKRRSLIHDFSRIIAGPCLPTLPLPSPSPRSPTLQPFHHLGSRSPPSVSVRQKSFRQLSPRFSRSFLSTGRPCPRLSPSPLPHRNPLPILDTLSSRRNEDRGVSIPSVPPGGGTARGRAKGKGSVHGGAWTKAKTGGEERGSAREGCGIRDVSAAGNISLSKGGGDAFNLSPPAFPSFFPRAIAAETGPRRARCR